MATAGGHVYCTLLMSDSYLPGALVLAHSLRDAGTTKKLAVLVTLDTLLPSTIAELKTVYDHVIPVERLSTPPSQNLALLGRYELRFAFTKIQLWRLIQFEKIVYVDADIVALRAPDELFDLDVPFAAAPDIGWPDCFNSGVMLLRPDVSNFKGLQKLAADGVSFDGADQGLFNEYYGDRWHRLSFTYNTTPSASYQYAPAYRRFGRSISMVHFTGKDKPWYQGRQALSSNDNDSYRELVGRWWAVFDRHFVTPANSAYGQMDARVKNVKQYVRGEDTISVFGWAASGIPSQSQDSAADTYSAPGFAAPTFSAPAFETPLYQPATRGTSDQSNAEEAGPTEQEATPVPHITTEEMMTDSGERSENIDQGVVQPQSTRQQRRFSAPKMEWDATRSQPPPVSRPEAEHFPSTRYEMSHDPGLFHAPQQYPEPPKDMWYQVPEIRPAVYEAPKPIFPWEQSSRPQPTRIFYEQPPPEPTQEPEPEVQVPGAWPEPEPETQPQAQPPVESTPESILGSSDPDFIPAPNWDAFSRANAWDEDVSIDRYVRALKIAQFRQGKIQVLTPTTINHRRNYSTATLSPETPLAGRRESLILTDFPTEDERPSLPVTPAPLRRDTFWGNDVGGDSSEQLAPAEGVPDQTDWVCPNCGHVFPAPIGNSSIPRAAPRTHASLSLRTAPAFIALPRRPSQALVIPTSSSVARTARRKPSISQSNWDFFERPTKPHDVPLPAVNAVSPSSSFLSATLSTLPSVPSPIITSDTPITTRKDPLLTSASFSIQKNPHERLEELRRTSIVTANEQQVGNMSQVLPQRQMPESAAPIPEPRSPQEKALPVQWQNLEEIYTGARTQERIEEAGNELARGIELKPPSTQSAARNIASASTGRTTIAERRPQNQLDTSPPDSPQRTMATFMQRNSQELTDKLVRDMETRVQTTQQNQQRRQMMRPRAATGFNRQRIALDEDEEEEEEQVQGQRQRGKGGVFESDEDDESEVQGREAPTGNAPVRARAKFERKAEVGGYGEYDIA